MSDLPNPTFEALYRDGDRLICSPTIPDIDTIRAGDFIICPDDWGSGSFTIQATEKGAHVRTGQYRWENTTVTRQRQRPMLVNNLTDLIPPPRGAVRSDKSFAPEVIDAQKTAFQITWDALSTPADRNPTYTPAGELLPEAWVPYLPFPTLNPAQAEAAPALLGDKPVIVVAPTGAGKTQLGMIATLAAIKRDGRKAAWLVPQRSLTAELDRELDTWRNNDIKVVALSGEARTDVAATQEADLWVATTEKFEALCRASSMKETIAQIGTIVVDEIHLLGEPSRGPILETLLARIRAATGSVRLVGLSATASNAAEVADWLGAELVTIGWRPTRLTTQVITVPEGSDNTMSSRYRAQASAVITKRVTGDGGSVLVFCGTKANVRKTALEIAASRGVNIDGVDANDTTAVARVCDEAKVGLHYSDWPAKHKAEKAFRDRDFDVLVATSTLAAGVNTPARAVIVRDTTIGPQAMEISMVQQMFGRAGRAGKEPEGWSFLLANPQETLTWRQRLAAGYTITSGIRTSVEEHLLGEITQRNITTLREATSWWEGTLAHHQGNHDTTPLTSARDFLATWKFITVTETGDGDQELAATRLGQITSRMMIGPRDAARIIAAFNDQPPVSKVADAEVATLTTIATSVRALSEGHDGHPEETRAIGDVLRTHGVPVPKQTRGGRMQSPMVSLAGLLIAARSPSALTGSTRQVHGVSRSALMPAVFEAPRYLAWVTAAASIGSLRAWAGPVALDLGRRIAWYRFNPPRGGGRLIWACEYASRGNHDTAVALYKEARENGCHTPEEWTARAGERMSRYSKSINTARATMSTLGGTTTVGPGCTGYTHANNKWFRAENGAFPAKQLGVSFSSRGDAVGNHWMEHFARTAG